MTFIVLRITSQIFVKKKKRKKRKSLNRYFLWYFTDDSTGVMGFVEKDYRSKVPFFSQISRIHTLLMTYLLVLTLSLGWWTVCQISPLYFFFSLSILNSVEEIHFVQPALKKWRVPFSEMKYLHKLFWIRLQGKCGIIYLTCSVIYL